MVRKRSWVLLQGAPSVPREMLIVFLLDAEDAESSVEMGAMPLPSLQLEAGL